jgi:hypothetical protein
MTRFLLTLSACLLAACTTTQYTPEERALAMRDDACTNRAVVKKPVWCPAPKDPLALSVERIDNPKGVLKNGRWER